ncbi:hypothetical protein P3T23_001356 [Paraburkholderia sp. GAS448]
MPPCQGNPDVPSSGRPNSRPTLKQGTMAIAVETENSTTFVRRVVAVLPFVE